MSSAATDPSARALLARLQHASSFEVAGAHALDAVWGVVTRALAAQPLPAAVERTALHLRPSGGYRGFLTRDAKGVAPGEVSGVLSSTTAWRALQRTRAAVAFDVTLGTLTDLEGRELDTPGAPTFDPTRTLQGLVARGVSHMLAVPLRGLGGGLDGMVTVEASCPEAIGTPFVWPEIVDAVQLLLDIATPFLAGLPMAPTAVESAGELLPVVGASTAPLVRLLRVFARQEETILISGPTGAGKSRLARWVHACSERSGGPFESVDLQAIPEELQLGELFGWRRGAFTGSVRDQTGVVERAHRGTLFIDEIDKLSMRAQAGLLRLLEERRFTVVGDSTERTADTRFVVGTNADLPALVKAGRFREDLYYRIHVLPVRLAPLCERADEIPGWAAWMVERRHKESRQPGTARLSADAALVLTGYAWPGNLRQLDNVVRRSYVAALAEGATGGLTIERRHADWALQGERVGAVATPSGALQAAAERVVARAIERGELDAELTNGFLGFVLAAAEARTGSREAALERFGMGTVVKNRNAHRVYRRELARAAALCRALGDEPPRGWEDAEG